MKYLLVLLLLAGCYTPLEPEALPEPARLDVQSLPENVEWKHVSLELGKQTVWTLHGRDGSNLVRVTVTEGVSELAMLPSNDYRNFEPIQLTQFSQGDGYLSVPMPVENASYYRLFVDARSGAARWFAGAANTVYMLDGQWILVDPDRATHSGPHSESVFVPVTQTYATGTFAVAKQANTGLVQLSTQAASGIATFTTVDGRQTVLEVTPFVVNEVKDLLQIGGESVAYEFVAETPGEFLLEFCYDGIPIC